MTPKVSVILPVSRGEKNMEQCLDSVRRQTLRDIEILCVGEGWDELEKIAREDTRIRFCQGSGRTSGLACWKQGVERAAGAYVLFLEPWNALEADACRRLYQKASGENVDILRFSAREGRQKLHGEAVFYQGFLQKRIRGAISDKLVSLPLCKKVAARIGEAEALDDENLYLLCLMSYYAESYESWNYNPYGLSCRTEGLQKAQMPALWQGRANACRLMEAFCQENNAGAAAQKYMGELRTRWLMACCRQWLEKLPKAQSLKGWESLCKNWGAQNVLSAMADLYFERRKEIAVKLAGYPQIPIQERQIKTVGLYYHKLYSGGIERVVSILAPMLAQMGYRVVILTDEPPTEQDYPVPREIARETVYSIVDTDHKTIRHRFASWTQIVEKQGIDLVIYNAWMSNLLLWDVLNLKEAGIPVVLYTHGVFSCPIAEFGSLFSELPQEVHLLDGMVTQSEADKLFWDQYGQNVHCIPNPSSPNLKNAQPASWENHRLVWVGRASPEKQPEKVFEIMEAVATQMPDVKLEILGDFENPKWQKMVKQKNLENNVIFRGMVPNVSDYLEKSSVYICTSQFEGFLMALVEAQAHKLPAVMFAIPHLTMATAERGVISVDMNDVSSAASEVVKLLRNRDWWLENSTMAYRSYQWLRDYDMAGAWQNVLSGNVPASSRNSGVSVMLNTLISHYDLGCRNRENVNAVTWFIQKIAGGIQCCVENGTGYTFRLALQKIRTRFGG